MKVLARSILETDIVGRPLRKLFWLLYKISSKQTEIAAKLLNRHPYIQKLNRFGPKAKSEILVETDRDSSLLRYYRNLQESISRLPIQPKISVLIPVYKVKIDFLRECLASLAAQVYKNWEACIVDDYSQDPEIKEVLEEFAQKYPDKVRLYFNESNLHISRTTNRALEMATGEYAALLDHDDRLLPNALGEMVRFMNLHASPDILFSDECVIDEKGHVLGTYHKPGWSPFMHLSVNYTTHLSVYRRAILTDIGGCRAGFEGAQDHDMMLRATEVPGARVVHVPINLYQWRSHQMSTASNSDAKPYAAIAGMKAVEEACKRRGMEADTIFEPKLHHYRLKFKVPQDEQPLVSIIIPTRDGFDLIQSCLESLFSKTLYRNFEVILIDHESEDPRCLDMFMDYAQLYPEKFRTISFQGAFNFAEMNNLGANDAKGDYLVLLNNDTEVLTPEWLDELLSVAQIPQVGAVGPKLLYPNGKIQHAGVIGLGPYIAGHAGCNEKADSLAYFGYFQTMHETLAVTGACLMISKEKYKRVGGLENTYVPNGFGDVDLCLKLRQAGFSNIYVPYASLLHKESVTRKVTFELFEAYYMLEKWSQELLCDPYRNPCLELGHLYRTDERFKVQVPSSSVFQKILSEVSLS